MRPWRKSWWWPIALGLVWGLVKAVLAFLGISGSLALILLSVLVYVGAVGIIWYYVYQVSHANDEKEKLLTAEVAAMREEITEGGGDASARLRALPKPKKVASIDQLQLDLESQSDA